MTAMASRYPRYHAPDVPYPSPPEPEFEHGHKALRRVRPAARIVIPIQINVPDLARAAGMSTRVMLARLREARVLLRQRGQGASRHHFFVTYADLVEGDGSWIPEAIEKWSALFARRDPPPRPEDDDEDG